MNLETAYRESGFALTTVGEVFFVEAVNGTGSKD